MTASRATSMSDPDAPLSVTTAVGSFGVVLVSAPAALAVFMASDAPISLSAPFVLFLFVDAVLEASCDIALGLASADITGAEAGLVMLLEIPLGPLFVYAAVGEVPATVTVIGCSALFCILVGHGMLEVHMAASASSNGAVEGNAKAGTALLASPRAGGALLSERSKSGIGSAAARVAGMV